MEEADFLSWGYEPELSSILQSNQRVILLLAFTFVFFLSLKKTLSDRSPLKRTLNL